LKHRAQSFSQWVNEKVEYHKELNPKFWEKEKMDPQIRKKLLTIASDFWKSLKRDIPVIDVQLTGSIANFNWTPESDLDVHILIDFSQIDDNIDLVRQALDGQRFMWNTRHPVVLRGHDVECYVQHKDEEHTASGLYSILRDEWIVVPEWTEPNVDEKDVSEKLRVIKKEFEMIKKRIPRAKGEEARLLHDYVDRFKKKIMADRKSGLSIRGEFSVENLVFKQLRREGIIEQMIDSMSELYSKIYSE
jgi:predicted nucleotidyltransferase